MKRFLLSCYGLMYVMACCSPQTAAAQVKQIIKGGQVPWTYELTVDPAAEPQPALKFRLLPDRLQRKAGNAAEFYYRAIILLQNKPEKDRQELDQLFTLSEPKPDQVDLPMDRVRKALQTYADVLHELDVARSRESCDWNIRPQDFQDYREILNFRVPELQEVRRLARLLRLKARLEIHERDYATALLTVQTGLQLSKDIAAGPLLFYGLVGNSIAIEMNGVLTNLIASQGAPNLYWALAEKSQPFIDIRPALELEISSALKFELLQHPERPRSPEEWQRVLIETTTFLQQSKGEAESKSREVITVTRPSAAALKLVKENYPRARQELIQFGLTDQQIGAMPEIQVIALHEWHVVRHRSDDLVKWIQLPYWQSRPFLISAKEFHMEESLPIFKTVAPSPNQVLFATNRLDRLLVRNQVVEALRLHAAVNNRKFPASLSDIKLVPIPLDPFTGQAVSYKLDGETAVLEFLTTPEQGVPSYGEIVRISLRKQE